MYEQWYDHAHQAVELQKEAVYGLTELYREEVRRAARRLGPRVYYLRGFMHQLL
jgi:N-acetyl-gamma-glutamyl-phosphate reductase